MSNKPVNKEVTLKERDNATPSERVRLECVITDVGWTSTTGGVYKLRRNPRNPKDSSCVELKERGQVKATINANISRLLAPLIDDVTIWETTWYVTLILF